MRFTDKELQRVQNARGPTAHAALFSVPRPAHLLVRPRASAPEPLVYCANDQTLSQRLVRPLPFGWGEASPQSSPSRRNPDATLPSEDDFVTSDYLPSQNPPTPRPLTLKRSRQWQRWTLEVIPMLFPVFIKLMYDTGSLRDTAGLALDTATTCNCSRRALDIALLLKADLFPCSPQHPSLAVDLQVLDFVMRLFLNLPPNNTAFCNTLEGFLASRGYKLRTKVRVYTVLACCGAHISQDTLGVHFGNALEWYISLQHAVNAAVDKLLLAGRDVVRAEDVAANPTDDDEVEVGEGPRSRSSTLTRPRTPSQVTPISSIPSTPTGRPVPPAPSLQKCHRQASVSPGEGDNNNSTPPANPFPEPLPRTWPSDYLISRCPACFGGLVHDPTQHVDVNVCADVCFTQKRRRKGARGPPRTHPNSVFVPETTANQMGAHVEEVRPPGARAPKTKKQARVEEQEDSYEGVNLKVPWSVLDKCESSFKAADEKREKASTKFFDDTGIMGLLCCHDRVLWLVNMRSAGEKQYYCCGFGFTNGEGCERFWHSISKLIAYLRVSGYHHRLYTIDIQIEHADKTSLRRLAGWLLRRTHHCEGKLRDALAELEACGVAEDVLREEWANQVAVQTKPVLRRSKNQGQAAVEEVLVARKKAQVLFERVASLEESVEEDDCTPKVRLYAELHLEDARKAWKEKERALRLQRMLGIDDSTALKKLAHSQYYSAQMNTKIFKEQLRGKLRDRKFELNPSKNQRNEHASAAITRREPNIARLVKLYNQSCVEIKALIDTKKAPKGAIAPIPVPAKGIYQLDVDDAIWQDLGLDRDEQGVAPLWLSDEKVRADIRALLQKDRCKEEAPRLLRERRHLRMWFATEWRAVCGVIAITQGAIQYQFQLRRQELLQLCVLWKKSLDQLAFSDESLPEWGPTREELLGCQIAEVTASWGGGYDSDSDDGMDDDEDDDLFQVLTAVERADNYRGPEDDEGESIWDDNGLFDTLFVGKRRDRPRAPLICRASAETHHIKYEKIGAKNDKQPMAAMQCGNNGAHLYCTIIKNTLVPQLEAQCKYLAEYFKDESTANGGQDPLAHYSRRDEARSKSCLNGHAWWPRVVPSILMPTQAQLTRFFRRASRAARAVPRAGSATPPANCRIARLRQTIMPDFLYGGAISAGSCQRPPTPSFAGTPDMNHQGPGPWTPQEAFGHAAVAAKCMEEFWADEAAMRQMLENVHDTPHAFAELITMSDMAFMSLLGPKATEYVRVQRADGGSLFFHVLPRGGLVPWGPGLDGFNSAVAADIANTAAADTGAQDAVEDAANVAGDVVRLLRPTALVTSGTTAVTLSSHSSLPSLLDALTDDEGLPATVFVLNPAQQRHLQEISLSGEEHESASDSIQRWAMGVERE
ncbi:hypothetical protein DFH09DRAFT_1092099 [Mycena vulgaris]|nr:hypothetical protein DFH09DRAFT_1092099 [Mycena vulgaris]